MTGIQIGMTLKAQSYKKISIQANSTLHWQSYFQVMAVMLGKRIMEMKTWSNRGGLRKRRRNSRQYDKRNDENRWKRGGRLISNGLLQTNDNLAMQIYRRSTAIETNWYIEVDSKEETATLHDLLVRLLVCLDRSFESYSCSRHWHCAHLLNRFRRHEKELCASVFTVMI